MRFVVSTASLLAVLWAGAPAVAAAQEPEPAPAPQAPPPPPRAVAVPRSDAITTRDPESPGPDRATGAGERAAPAAERRRVRAEAPPPARDPRGERAGGTITTRRLPVASASAAVSEADEEQARGAQRRGAVRRPPPDRVGAPRDRGVPRTSVPAPRPSTPAYVYPRSPYYGRFYDPWGYGAFGLGYYYHSPWGWSPGYYGGYGAYGPPYSAYGYALGAVKLKVTPRDAEVYVDGYFAGHVDDFDGVFQSLKLDSGAYRIEIRKAGFETLYFDVRVQPERTITYRGVLQPVP